MKKARSRADDELLVANAIRAAVVVEVFQEPVGIPRAVFQVFQEPVGIPAAVVVAHWWVFQEPFQLGFQYLTCIA